MTDVIAEIQEDITWRTKQLALTKALPIKYQMTSYHACTVNMYSVPYIYAIWEGYIGNTFRLYISYLNNKNLTIDDLDLNVLTHAIDNKCELDKQRDFDQKKKLVQQLHSMINNPITIEEKVSKANATFRVTNSLLSKFNLSPLDKKFDHPLNKLLMFRNKIAHGEKAIRVKKEHIEEFTLLVEELMGEILITIDESIQNEKYKYIP